MFGPTTTHAYRTALSLFGLVLLVSLAACGNISPPVSQSKTVTPSPATTLPPARYQIIEHSNMAYGPLTAEKLDLCEPVDAPSPRPGIILIHGGGWTEANETNTMPSMQTTCRDLAAQGFIVANVNYRLATVTANGHVVTQDMWPAQLVDVQLAVRWMRAQARQLGLDSTRICAQGYSAGAHLAVFLGSLAINHAGDEASLLRNQSPKVSCVVDFYGPVDLTKVSYVDSYYALFGDNMYNAAVLREASPVFDVSSQSAPTLIIQGTKDSLVPPSQAMELYQALQHNHVPVQYLSYNGGHAGEGAPQQQVISVLAQTLAFLVGSLHP